MNHDRPSALPRRALLKGAALAGLTTLALAHTAPGARAAAPALATSPEPDATTTPHPSYAAIVGLL
jgi:nitrous oxide reductase